MAKIVLNMELLFWGYFNAVNENVMDDELDLLDKLSEIENSYGIRSDGYEYDSTYEFSTDNVTVDINRIEE